MEKGKILVDVLNENLLQKSKIEEKNCIGERCSEDMFFYREKDGTKVTLIVKEDHLLIERNGENTTRILCNPKKVETASMMTEFGEFQFSVNTDYIKRSSRLISVQYTLSQGDILINKAHIRWIIKEVQA